ncbi:MAG: DNA polymerase III subunit beta [Patescibacteria group bacterium]|nr:DNA polymerase III subunit beta [Patescibacteria group bacterium]
MKLVVFQENLAKAFNTAGRFVSSRAQLPVLQNFLLEAGSNSLKISATNLETGICLSLPVKVEKQGSICVPARVLTEFVSSLPASKVELSVKSNKLTVLSPNYSSEFLGVSAGEFPPMPEKSKEKDLSFKKDFFLSAIDMVVFSASSDEGRPVLTGVLFIVRDNKLLLVATDGYRLSLKTLTETDLITEELKKGLIIPAKTLSELSRIISDLDTEEKISLNINRKASQLIFSISGVDVISRLIEGEYPDFEKIIPKENKTKINLDSQEFLRAVKIASIFARENANIVKLNFVKDEVEIASSTSQVGSNKNKLAVKIDGPDGEIAFNCRYLLDFLSTSKSETVNFEMDQSLSPGVFTFPSDKDYCHIIMPVRIQE